MRKFSFAAVAAIVLITALSAPALLAQTTPLPAALPPQTVLLPTALPPQTTLLPVALPPQTPILPGVLPPQTIPLPAVLPQQSVARFEYLRLTTYNGVVTSVRPASTSPDGLTMTPASASMTPGGVRACIAAHAQWTCRNFEGQASRDDAFRTALVTLGNEGWEIVSADGDTGEYIFKRQLQ